MSPRSISFAIAKASSPTSFCRTNSWKRPVRSCRSKKMTFPCPRADMIRPASDQVSPSARPCSGRSAYLAAKPAACAVTSYRVAENGSTPRSRSAARLARRAATRSLMTCLRGLLGFLGVLVDRLDLVLHLTARRGDVDRLAFLAAHQRAPERRLVGEPRVLRIGLSRADDGELVAGLRARLDDLDRRAEVHFICDVVARVDDARVADHRFEFEDASFDKGLLLLRILVFGVFRHIAEFFGLPNALVDLAAMHGLEVVELVFELLQTITGQNDFFVVQKRLPRDAPAPAFDARRTVRPLQMARGSPTIAEQALKTLGE